MKKITVYEDGKHRRGIPALLVEDTEKYKRVVFTEWGMGEDTKEIEGIFKKYDQGIWYHEDTNTFLFERDL